MTTNIVPFPKREGNGAREALMNVMRDPASRCLGEWDTPAATDYILARLYTVGFVVVPMEGK